MDNIQTETQLPAEQELEQLNKRQEELRKKLDEANRKKTLATLDSLAASAKKREEEEAEDRRVLEEIARRKRERLVQDESEQRAREQKAAQERQVREAQLAKERAARSAKEAELERVRREKAKAAQLEQELCKLEAEILRGISAEAAAPVEAAPSALNNPAHPLSRIFGTEGKTATSAVEVDTVEIARKQAKEMQQRENETNKPWRPVPGRHFVDQNESNALQTSWHRRTGYRPNNSQIDHLLTRWTGSDIEIAFQQMLQMHSKTPLGVVAQVTFVEHILNQAQAGHEFDEIRTQS